MKSALLMSNGETVALASRLIAAGVSVCTAQAKNPLPACDALFFDESIPLLSPEGRMNTKRLIGEALASRKPVIAILSPAAPVTPKCGVVMSELLSYSSAAVTTPNGAEEILGLDRETDQEIDSKFEDNPSLARSAALAKALMEAHDLSFALVFDPDEGHGVLFAGDAYDMITAQSFENAVSELFYSAS